MLIVISTRPLHSVSLSLSHTLSFFFRLELSHCTNVFYLAVSLEIVIMPQNVARPLVDFALQLSQLRLRLVRRFILPRLFVIYVTISLNRA